MLNLRFKAPQRSQTVAAPAGFRFIQNALYIEGQDSALATFDGAVWMYGGSSFPRIECTGFICVHFESEEHRRSKPIGPRPSFHLLHAHAFAGRQPVASFDRTNGLWHVRGSAEHWPAMVITPAET
jgi:hypothetical protein